MEYSEIYTRLYSDTAIIIFYKKDNSIRVMLGTRNMSTVSLLYGFQGGKLNGHDKRCNINNGNIAVFDLEAGDARSFNIDRIVRINYLGNIDNKAELDKQLEEFLKFKEEYMNSGGEDQRIQEIMNN